MNVLTAPRLSVAGLALLGSFGFGSAGATVVTTGCANANLSCTAFELFTGATITIDDKRFDQWSLFFLDFSTPVAPDPALIEVVPLDDDPANPGLQFNANGQGTVLDEESITVGFGFRVSTLDGVARIKDNSLSLDDFSFGGAGGFIGIEEFIIDANGVDLGDKFVRADNLFGVFQLLDQANFAPQAEIFVEKTLFIAGDQVGDSVSLDRFTQRFSQVVPAPATLPLFAIGLLALPLGRGRGRAC